jgi:hypothetical protein
MVGVGLGPGVGVGPRGVDVTVCVGSGPVGVDVTVGSGSVGVDVTVGVGVEGPTEGVPPQREAPVTVTSSVAKAWPSKSPLVVLMDVPARIVPRKTESVSVAACAVHQNTLLLHASPPGMTTVKSVPVRAPMPPVPILKIQVSAADPSSVNTPPVYVADASTQ